LLLNCGFLSLQIGGFAVLFFFRGYIVRVFINIFDLVIRIAFQTCAVERVSVYLFPMWYAERFNLLNLRARFSDFKYDS
jgi:hypothetical protein